MPPITSLSLVNEAILEKLGENTVNDFNVKQNYDRIFRLGKKLRLSLDSEDPDLKSLDVGFEIRIGWYNL